MKKITIVAIIVAVVSLAAFAAFGLLSPQIWNSPDETAVAFFAKHMSYGGNLASLETFNAFKANIVHPRSIVSVDGFLSPGSFYGTMYIFAGAIKVFGQYGFAIGTPILVALAGLLIFFSLRRLFGEREALIAEILFFANPGIWYFASRGLFPNAMFIALAVIGAAVFYLRPWQSWANGRGLPIFGKIIDYSLASFVLGMAFLVRPVEFLWLLPLLFVWAFAKRKSLGWASPVIVVIWAALFVATFLYINNSLYGSPWAVGYTVGSSAPGVSVPALSQGSSLPAAISAPRPFVLPFGFHPRFALTNVWNYVILFAWWLPALALIGFLLTTERKRRQLWLRVWVWVTLLLGIYYGSGLFLDSSVSQWTVGSSYIRYFLPASIILIPLAAEGLWLAGKKRWKYVAPILAVFVLLSGWTVYFRSAESLVPMRKQLGNYQVVKDYVLKETKAGDFIITERSDKIFFPDRRVVLNLRDPKTLSAIPDLLDWANVYYYGITISEKELPEINKELHNRKVQLGRVKSFGNETLYSITKEQ